MLQGVSPLKALLALVGIGRDPLKMTAEERVLDAYYDRLAVYAVDKSRVIVVEFQSRDPDLAAQVANSIAEGYLVLQQATKQDQARSAGQWLSGKIDDLRKKVADADSRVEDFRSKAGLFIGTNNTTLSNQQMGEINTQLNNARAQKANAESKAHLIRDMLQSGGPVEVTDVLNSEFLRRLNEQRVTLRAPARRAIGDAARRPSAHQGAQGPDQRSRPADPRRSCEDGAFVRERRQARRRAPSPACRPASTSSRSRPATTTNRTCSCARSIARPRRSAICWNPIWRSIARRPRAKTSTWCRPMPASSRAASSPIRRRIRRRCRSS